MAASRFNDMLVNTGIGGHTRGRQNAEMRWLRMQLLHWKWSFLDSLDCSLGKHWLPSEKCVYPHMTGTSNEHFTTYIILTVFMVRWLAKLGHVDEIQTGGIRAQMHRLLQTCQGASVLGGV